MHIYHEFENLIAHKIKSVCDQFPDPSHDYLHVLRVVDSAKKIAAKENADLNIVVPAAYLHDVVIIAKNSPLRNQASRLSAEEAVRFLKQNHYPEKYLHAISHAIMSHSFSAQIKAETLEAKVVQDADRLDGLGAIGVARCFTIGGLFNRPFYFPEDPFCESRKADDQTNSLDHFFVKLYKVAETLHTPTAQLEGKKRLEFLKVFVEQLQKEI